MYTKLVPETVYNIKFRIKIYLQLFLYIYLFYHLFGNIYKSIFYNSNTTLNYRLISKTNKIWGNLISKCPLHPWYTKLYDLSNILSFIFKNISCIFTTHQMLQFFKLLDTLSFFCSVIILVDKITWNSWRDAKLP